MNAHSGIACAVERRGEAGNRRVALPGGNGIPARGARPLDAPGLTPAAESGHSTQRPNLRGLSAPVIDASAERPDPSLHVILRVHAEDQFVRSTPHLEAVLRRTRGARECANTRDVLQREHKRRQEQPA